MDQIREAAAPNLASPRREIPAHERAALHARRERAGIGQHAPRIGLALSGGGVRSATFCLGLLRALAKHGVLHRFDYLSTVSGGGYIGAAFGRLFNARATPREVEQGLADDGSLALWWLRSNGRYLVPAGARDLLQTAAGQLRGFVATQFEATTLMALLSCVIVLPHLLARWGDRRWPACSTAPCGGPPCRWRLDGDLWPSPTGGRAIRRTARPGATWRSASARSPWRSTCCARCGRWMPCPATGATAMSVAGITLLAVPLAWIWCAACVASRPDRDRVRYTVALTTAVKCLLLLFVLGGADVLSWFLADQIVHASLQAPALTTASVSVALIALARFALPMLQSLGQSSKPSMARLPLALIGNVAGLLLVVLLVLFWLTALQYFVFVMKLSAMDTWMHWLTDLVPGFASWPAADTWLRWLTVFVPALAFTCLTGRNLQQVNRSSLHAYLPLAAGAHLCVAGQQSGAGHAGTAPLPGIASGRQEPGQCQPRDPAHRACLAGDDIDLPEYTPHAHGGPIHLINCCINQTWTTVPTPTTPIARACTSRSARWAWRPAPRCRSSTARAAIRWQHSTLAEWIAISGAAAGSGMGSLTRAGISALFFLSGFRLGYWWHERPRPEAVQVVAGWASRARYCRKCWRAFRACAVRSGISPMAATSTIPVSTACSSAS